MRIYNFKIKYSTQSYQGRQHYFYRIFNKDNKRLMTLEFNYIPSKNKLKQVISKNLYRPVLAF